MRTPGTVGDVTLVAPHGVVDAGEAGIGGRNVAIAATAIIGVTNIQATGTLTGAPPPAPAFATSLTGASQLAAGANQAADTALAESMDNTRQTTQPVTVPMPVNLLSVEVVGFGDCGLADIRQGKPGCQP